MPIRKCHIRKTKRGFKVVRASIVRRPRKRKK